MQNVFNAGPMTLSLTNLPGLAPPSAEVAARVEAKYQEWIRSDFAGYRRILDPQSLEHPDLKKIEALAKHARQGSSGKMIRNFVVLGTGGSSLGAEALISALLGPFAQPQFFFMDNNDPDFFAEHLKHWDPSETFVYAVSKSGSTPETWSQLMVVIPWLQAALGDAWKRHLALCTDPEQGDFRRYARAAGLDCFDIPSAVGGRFSVFTPVGLFPTAFAGLRNHEFLEGAAAILAAWERLPLVQNPAFRLAHALVEIPQHRVTVVFSYSSYLRAFGRWFAQLWGESLGKEERGFTPYAAIGTTDQHSQTQLYMEGPKDKIFAFHSFAASKYPLPLLDPAGADDLNSLAPLRGKSMDTLFRAELRATEEATTAAALPNFSVTLAKRDERSLGALLFFWQWVTTYAGAFLDIDPFNQPGVEQAKILTKKYLATSP